MIIKYKSSKVTLQWNLKITGQNTNHHKYQKEKLSKYHKPYQWYTNVKTSNTRDVSISVSI